MNKIYTDSSFPQTPINDKRKSLAIKCTTMLKSCVMYVGLVLFFFIGGNTFGQSCGIITWTDNSIGSFQSCGGVTKGFNANGDYSYTSIITNPQSLTFDKKRSSNTTAWSMDIQISPDGGALSWTTITTITSISNTCETVNIDLSSYTGTRRIRFIDTRSSGVHERAISNIVINCATYTVSYNGNGSDGGTVPSDASSPYASGSTVTVLGAGTMTKTGNTFAGWNTAADGSGTAYAAAATFSITSNVTLYAQWTPAGGKTVTFNGNGNNGGSMAPQTASSSTALTANAFTKTGYDFSIWNTAADGSGTDYADGVTYSFAADMTLYAQWSINNYNVVYDGNSPSSGTAPVTQNGNYNTTITLATNSGGLAKTGFAFTGWNTAINGSGTHYNTSASFTIPASHTTLYAEWTPT
ncbi:MAG: InlB B-repeat-containing protein, partial [Chitinophagales bacterium]|nr:InlB B-repeat-containing protein [Chitinophagales bacterium]